MIIDSIKHISGMVSSVREVLPGRAYFIPKTQEKAELLDCTSEEIAAVLKLRSMPVFKAIYTGFTGISPCVAHELCVRAGIDADWSSSELEEDAFSKLTAVLRRLADDVQEGRFYYNVVYENHNRLSTQPRN